MTYYHYRNVRLYNGLMLSQWMTKDSPEQLRLMEERMALIDDILYGLPWRLNYRKINENLEPVQSKHSPPIMW